MTETQERFLRTILSRVESGTVVELHLFPPIRRGTLETGVAVIATELPPAPLAMVSEEPDAGAGATAAAGEAEGNDAAGNTGAVAGAGAGAGAKDGAMEDAVSVLPAHVDEVGAPAAAAMAGGNESVDGSTGWAQEAIRAVEAVEHGGRVGFIEQREPPEIPDGDALLGHVVEASEAESPYRDEAMTGDADFPRSTAEHDLADMTSDAGAEFAPEPEPAVAAPSRRLRILTASYRHTIKGVDRGKWTVDVQVEADVPAEAIEAVLRGVRHRSTEPADPELVALDVLTHLVAPAVIAPAA